MEITDLDFDGICQQKYQLQFCHVIKLSSKKILSGHKACKK